MIEKKTAGENLQEYKTSRR